MSDKIFLLQGLTQNTHLNAVKELLSLDYIESAILSVAFVSYSGVELIKSELQRLGSRAEAYVGIRNGITTKEGVASLINTGIKVYCVDTGATNLVFHPKIYIGIGQSSARAIVGSANLTLGGLHNNIESSVILDFDLKNSEEAESVSSAVGVIEAVVKDYPRHVRHVASNSDVESLFREGLLVDEATSTQPQTVPYKTLNNDNIPKMDLKVHPLKSSIHRIQDNQKTDPQRELDALSDIPSQINPQLELVWRSKELTERDLGVPSSPNTNRTGSINLDKGQLEKSIDHRHYFREDVFNFLDWKPTNRPNLEDTHASFALTIKGIHRGEFNLRLAHSTSQSSASYLQRNAMTRLSWGPMQKIVADRGLIGRTLSLFRNQFTRRHFVIEID